MSEFFEDSEKRIEEGMRMLRELECMGMGLYAANMKRRAEEYAKEMRGVYEKWVRVDAKILKWSQEVDEVWNWARKERVEQNQKAKEIRKMMSRVQEMEIKKEAGDE